MQVPKCPRCGKNIPTDDVNVATDVALCRSCNLVSALSSLVSGYSLERDVDLQQPPLGCWHRSTGFGTLVGATHRALGAAFGLLAISLFWNGIVSVFVLVAVSSTLHLLHVPVPDWFPAPKMNGQIMSVGMTIFIWIFLSPFITIGLAMIAGLLSCLGGKTEVRVERGEVAVATGIGPIAWNRRFMAADLKEIRIEESHSQMRNRETQTKLQIVAELQGGRLIKFGSSLREDRLRFLAAAADKLIRS
jgi:hypothetical protein